MCKTPGGAGGPGEPPPPPSHALHSNLSARGPLVRSVRRAPSSASIWCAGSPGGTRHAARRAHMLSGGLSRRARGLHRPIRAPAAVCSRARLQCRPRWTDPHASPPRSSSPPLPPRRRWWLRRRLRRRLRLPVRRWGRLPGRRLRRRLGRRRRRQVGASCALGAGASRSCWAWGAAGGQRAGHQQRGGCRAGAEQSRPVAARRCRVHSLPRPPAARCRPAAVRRSRAAGLPPALSSPAGTGVATVATAVAVTAAAVATAAATAAAAGRRARRRTLLLRGEALHVACWRRADAGRCPCSAGVMAGARAAARARAQQLGARRRDGRSAAAAGAERVGACAGA